MPARFLTRDGDVRVSLRRYDKERATFFLLFIPFRLFIYIVTIFSTLVRQLSDIFGQFGEISRICRIVAKRGSRITSSNGSTAEIFVASAVRLVVRLLGPKRMRDLRVIAAHRDRISWRTTRRYSNAWISRYQPIVTFRKIVTFFKAFE